MMDHSFSWKSEALHALREAPHEEGHMKGYSTHNHKPWSLVDTQENHTEIDDIQVYLAPTWGCENDAQVSLMTRLEEAGDQKCCTTIHIFFPQDLAYWDQVRGQNLVAIPKMHTVACSCHFCDFPR